MPNPRHTEIHRTFVNAKPDAAWALARHFDMSQIPWVKLLFDIRTFPEKLAAKKPAQKNVGLDVNAIAARDTGFMILHETPGKEVVVGSVGEFWHVKIPFKKVKPEQFRDFMDPGFGKIAWCISVEPFMAGSTISVELRTTATDDASWQKLNQYYQVIGIGSRLIRISVMSQVRARLGKMKLPDFKNKPLIGDELIPDARYGITFHQDIEAPVSIVWQYLMQLGCDRAGWYSIDTLDNGGRKSTDHLVDRWGERKVGDRLSATPADEGFFEVYDVESERHFVIGCEQQRMGRPFKMTWAFILERIGEDACRLIARARMKFAPRWAEWLMGRIVYPPVHGLMSRIQLVTIMKHAERDAQARIVSDKTLRLLREVFKDR